LLAYLPVETVIKRRQQVYYDELAVADAQSDCSRFIEFILTAIEESLHEAIRIGQNPETLGKTQGKTPERILDLLRGTSGLAIPQLAASLGKSESAIERAIRKLRQASRLVRIGPDKGGHWQVLDGSDSKQAD